MTKLNAIFVSFASIAFVISGVLLLLNDSLLIFMEWYSGVEYEPPLRTIDRVINWIRIAAIAIAVIVALFAYLIPYTGAAISHFTRQGS